MKDTNYSTITIFTVPRACCVLQLQCHKAGPIDLQMKTLTYLTNQDAKIGLTEAAVTVGDVETNLRQNKKSTRLVF